VNPILTSVKRLDGVWNHEIISKFLWQHTLFTVNGWRKNEASESRSGICWTQQSRRVVLF
jgi:hypothetical protein